MMECKKIKTYFSYHQTTLLITNSCLYSSDAHRCVKNVLLSFWNVNIHFSFMNIGRKTSYWQRRTLYEIWILKTKTRSTGKTLTAVKFCGVRTSIFHFLSLKCARWQDPVCSAVLLRKKWDNEQHNLFPWQNRLFINTLMTNEMHNSYNQFYSTVLCLLRVS